MAGFQKQKSGDTIKEKASIACVVTTECIQPGFIIAASAELMRNVGEILLI